MDKHPSNNLTESVTLAYVLKGFPRLSEIFIASEIYRLEQLGIKIKLLVIKPADEPVTHEIIESIQAKPVYLPATTSLSGTFLLIWLARHLGAFLPALLRVFFHHPVKTIYAFCLALAQAIRARKTFWSPPRKVYFKEFLQAAFIADNLLRSNEAVHLHAHFCHGATTVTWLASIITGIQFSFTAHAKDIYCDTLNPAGLLKRKMDAAKFVVTCTDANREYLQPLSSTKVHCIYHGLNADFTRLLQATTENPSKNGRIRLLSVGRLVRKKGFDTLIDACNILNQRGVDFETLIIGQPDEQESELKNRIANYSLSHRIRLVEAMTQKQLFDEYRKATTFCLPCRVLENGDRDGIPNVLVEAMACGLPIITTGISGIPEIVHHGVNGWLIPPDNPEALAEALLHLSFDKPLAQAVALGAQQTVHQRFDGDRFAAHLAGIFKEAIA
ncbi:MAG: glycosyltransferase family 4 protein [Acidobacteriota bacterium]